MLNDKALEAVSTVHELKTIPEIWDAVNDGTKPFEVRKNDRGFKVRDVLRLYRSTHPDDWRGAPYIDREVTFILTGGVFGLAPDYCVMGIRPLSALPTGGETAGGVRVKALEWERRCDGNVFANTPFGLYFAYHSGSWTKPGHHVSVEDGNLEAAKAAAQSDYEARIRSALEPAPALPDRWVAVPREATREMADCLHDDEDVARHRYAAALAAAPQPPDPSLQNVQRTYQDGIEDAAKEAEDRGMYSLTAAIRKLGEKG